MGRKVGDKMALPGEIQRLSSGCNQKVRTLYGQSQIEFCSSVGMLTRIMQTLFKNLLFMIHDVVAVHSIFAHSRPDKIGLYTSRRPRILCLFRIWCLEFGISQSAYGGRTVRSSHIPRLRQIPCRELRAARQSRETERS